MSIYIVNTRSLRLLHLETHTPGRGSHFMPHPAQCELCLVAAK